MRALTRRDTRTQGFTLIELLIVVAIIGVLATLLLGAVFKSRARALSGVAKSEIQAIRAALSMYESDHGRFPRHTVRPTAGGTDGAWYNDDAPALYMALRNRPTRELGGGQNSPYLDWKPEKIGKLHKDYLATDQMGNDSSVVDAESGTWTGALALDPTEYDQVSQAAFQDDYLWAAQRQLVFLDPWGNPYHYREWRSVRQQDKDTLVNATVTRTVTGPADAQLAPGPFNDRPHNIEGFDVWSNGPNGVNEFGAVGSDDITSWSN